MWGELSLVPSFGESRCFVSVLASPHRIVDHGVDHDRGGEAPSEVQVAPPIILRT